MEQLEELLTHTRQSHSALQIEHFIVVKGGAFCDYGALRQSLRELRGRVSVVKEGLFKLRELEIDIEELLESSDKRTQVDLDRVRFEQTTLERDVAERAFELSQFYAIAAALKAKIEHEHGELTPELHAKLDAEMWEHRLMFDAAYELRSSSTLSSGLHQLIAALPFDARSRIMGKIMQPQSLIAWVNQHRYELPAALPALSAKEVCNYVAHDDCTRRRVS